MKHITAPLLPGMYYHIYNRANNRENLFLEKRNYPYFLSLYALHIAPIADTYAYCLLRNHFHFSVRIKTEEEYLQQQTSQLLENPEVLQPKKFDPSQNFANLFNAYAKSINKGYGRTGSLFEERFGRIPVTSDSYFATLIFYIHYNPQKHRFVDNFRDWEWSSYHGHVGTGQSKLKCNEVLNMFGGVKGFEEFHQGRVDEKKIAMLVDEEFELEAQLPANPPRNGKRHVLYRRHRSRRPVTSSTLPRTKPNPIPPRCSHRASLRRAHRRLRQPADHSGTSARLPGYSMCQSPGTRWNLVGSGAAGVRWRPTGASSQRAALRSHRASSGLVWDSP